MQVVAFCKIEHKSTNCNKQDFVIRSKYKLLVVINVKASLVYSASAKTEDSIANEPRR